MRASCRTKISRLPDLVDRWQPPRPENPGSGSKRPGRPWRRGWQSRPSGPAKDSRRAQDAVPSAAPGPRASDQEGRPTSMIEETNAANSGAPSHARFESSVWMKSNPLERMLRVLDAAIHMHAATGCKHGAEWSHWRPRPFSFSPPLETRTLSRGHNGDLCEQCARRLPAFRASACVVIGALGGDCHLDGIARAFAMQRPTRKARRAGWHAIVDCRNESRSSP